MSSAREAEPSVGELLRGWYTPEQQQPDADLGKSIREGWRSTDSPSNRVSTSAVMQRTACLPEDLPFRASRRMIVQPGGCTYRCAEATAVMKLSKCVTLVV